MKLHFPVNEKRGPTRGDIAGASFLAVIVVGIALYLLRSPPHYDVLDHRLGSRAWEPAHLFEVLSWEYKDDRENLRRLDQTKFFEIKHQALLRLLDLQEKRFRRPAIPRATGGTIVDHSFAEIASVTPDRIIVIGTGTLKPVRIDTTPHGDEPYWQLERFTFTRSGELLSRESFSE